MATLLTAIRSEKYTLRVAAKKSHSNSLILFDSNFMISSVKNTLEQSIRSSTIDRVYWVDPEVHPIPVGC